MISKLENPWALAACIRKAEEAVGTHFLFAPTGERAASILSCVRRECPYKDVLAYAAEEADTLNEYLEQWGMSIRLGPIVCDDGEYAFGVVARTEHKLSWLIAPSKTTVDHAGGTWQALRVPAYMVETPLGEAYVVSGQHDESVWVFPGMVSRPFVTAEFAIAGAGFRRSIDLIFPMVSLRAVADTSYLIGLKGNFVNRCTTLRGDRFGTVGLNTVRIDQAVQEDIFGMDEKGVHVLSAAAAQFTLGTGCCTPHSKQLVIVDEPFTAAAAIGSSVLMAGSFGTDSWLPQR